MGLDEPLDHLRLEGLLRALRPRPLELLADLGPQVVRVVRPALRLLADEVGVERRHDADGNAGDGHVVAVRMILVVRGVLLVGCVEVRELDADRLAGRLAHERGEHLGPEVRVGEDEARPALRPARPLAVHVDGRDVDDGDVLGREGGPLGGVLLGGREVEPALDVGLDVVVGKGADEPRDRDAVEVGELDLGADPEVDDGAEVGAGRLGVEVELGQARLPDHVQLGRLGDGLAERLPDSLLGDLDGDLRPDHLADDAERDLARPEPLEAHLRALLFERLGDERLKGRRGHVDVEGVVDRVEGADRGRALGRGVGRAGRPARGIFDVGHVGSQWEWPGEQWRRCRTPNLPERTPGPGEKAGKPTRPSTLRYNPIQTPARRLCASRVASANRARYR